MTAATLPFAEPAGRINPLTGLRNTFTLTWRSVLKIGRASCRERV